MGWGAAAEGSAWQWGTLGQWGPTVQPSGHSQVPAVPQVAPSPFPAIAPGVGCGSPFASLGPGAATASAAVGTWCRTLGKLRLWQHPRAPGAGLWGRRARRHPAGQGRDRVTCRAVPSTVCTSVCLLAIPQH